MVAGHNIPYMFSQFRGTNYYIPTSVIEKIDVIGPQVLRFPGGTLGNRYNRLANGYGLPTDTAPVNFIERYLTMISMMDVKPRTSYVANIYQALLKPMEYQYWLDGVLLAVSDLRPDYIELGNELNIDGVWLQVADKPGWFESVTSYKNKVARKAYEYLEMADKYLTAIKQVHPTAKIGIPMGNHEKTNIRNGEWNRVLRTWGKNDAEIFHMYLKTRQYLDTKYEIERHIAGAKKPVWITEWSWEHGNSDTLVKNLADVGTLYYKYFFQDFPRICAADKRIEMICRHQLYGSNIYSIIKP